MTKSEIEKLAGKVGIPCTVDDLASLRDNPAFQRFEQALFDKLNDLYELIALRLFRDPLTGKISPAGPEETEQMRGQIGAFRFVLNIPSKIESEAKMHSESPVALAPEDQEEVDDFIQGRYMNKGE